MRKTKLAEKSSYKRRVRQIKAPHYRQVRRRRGAFLYFDIDCNARLEFHSEVVGEDDNLLDKLFDQSLIKLCDIGFLTGDEVLQLLDPVHDFFPVMAVEFGLFLLVAEYENMIKNSKYTSNKELLTIPGAVHTDLYDNLDVIPFDKIQKFFEENGVG